MATDKSQSPNSITDSPPCCSSAAIRNFNNLSDIETSMSYQINFSSSSEDNENSERPHNVHYQTVANLSDSSDEISNQRVLDEAGIELSSEYANNAGAIFVSAMEYSEKKKQIDNLVQKMLGMEQLQRQLEENGSNNEELLDLRLRLEKLNTRLELLGEFLDTLRVQEDQPSNKVNEEPEQIEQPRWSNLYSGLNRHRHKTKHTSAEFYQHKSNIINSLKMLYEPSEPSPTADDLEEQPALLMVRLLKHQKAALKWMQFRERQTICGGILADDMGLGKTLSMISLVLASQGTKSKKRVEKQRSLELKWTQEFNLVYNKKIPKFNIFDDEEESAGEEEITEPSAKRLCQEPEATNFSSDEEEEHAVTIRYPPAGTLVVCPMSLMCQWAEEVASKVAPNALRVLTYHGANRQEIGLEVFRSYDLVITSYNLLVSENKRFGNSSLLFAVVWNRVILDEAHIIRNVKTSCCSSVCQLRARCHWALTGTPVQNRAVDVFALLRFLEVPNFRDLQQWKKYLNEGMDGHRRLNFIIKPLMLRRTKQQLQESGDMPALPPLKIELISVQLSEPEMAVYQILSAISQKIFTQFLLQREEANSDLNYYSLEKTPQFIKDIFEAKYTEIYHRFLRSLGYNPGATIKGIVILVLLLRLRQFCCHPGLMLGMLCGSMTAEDVQNVRTDVSDVEGQLKMDVLAELDKYDKPVNKEDFLEEEGSFPGNRSVKTDDIKVEDIPLEGLNKQIIPWDMEVEQQSCSSTNPLDAARAIKLLNPQNPIFEFARSSAKLKLVIDKLEKLLADTNDKIIVTSQWISYLAIIRKRLQDQSWETLDFTGQLSAKDRELVLREFNANNDKRVLLLSLTAGGVGLNLNVANHMLMVDLHWNPQLERQAQDRIYRYGQNKPTFIYRYICQDTVEQRIKALQDYKLEIAKVVLPEEDGGVSARGGGGLNLAELKKLFSM
ncbi:transcription termination factor 2 [Drosophila rhopaloa]|uniref:Transcription termination factor 2 n=1 Tax=Drosophila rhopaloa TaxID=1041015 RepID=A0A6P4EDX0_DRORH|nr:transcription termination factor 2 [Drosophila rhopaloa]